MRPFQAPGILTEPPVSDPIPAKQIPADTATADPPELPPEIKKSLFSRPPVSGWKDPSLSVGTDFNLMDEVKKIICCPLIIMLISLKFTITEIGFHYHQMPRWTTPQKVWLVSR